MMRGPKVSSGQTAKAKATVGGVPMKRLAQYSLGVKLGIAQTMLVLAVMTIFASSYIAPEEHFP